MSLSSSWPSQHALPPEINNSNGSLWFGGSVKFTVCWETILLGFLFNSQPVLPHHHHNLDKDTLTFITSPFKLDVLACS